MDFEELVAGVRKHHGAFVGRIEGQKLLQVGGASGGAFAEWFRRQGREVDVDGNDKDYDAAFSQGMIDGMIENDILKLVKKTLKRAPVFVISVPSATWRYANVKRNPARYAELLSKYDVEVFPYWGGKMLCIVVRKTIAPVIEKAEPEIVEPKIVEPEAEATEVPFSEWTRE